MTSDIEKDRKEQDSSKKNEVDALKKLKRLHSSGSSDDEDSYRRRKKKERRKERKKNRRKREKKRKKHRKRYYSTDEESNSFSSDSEDSSSTDKSSKNRRKKSRKKKKKCRSTSSRSKIVSVNELSSPPIPSFGKYGIVKPSDMKAKERSFNVWMAEIKGVPSFTGSKWELQNYFREYAEDFNTATLPDIKYYDYDKWELQEYQKKREEENKKMKSSNLMLADEARHQAAMRQKKSEKRQSELKLLRATMNSEKILNMKRQKDLQAELSHAYKTGDKKRVARIKQKLEPAER